jgi:hypothetical protein
MIRHTSTLLAVAGALFLVTGLAAAQAPAAPAARKLVNPVKGEAQIQFLPPVVKQDAGMIITTIKVKNMSPAPIAGFKVDEFWYDKKGEVVGGSQTFRSPKPLQPGQVIDVVLRVKRGEGFFNNTYKFEHANGSVKPTRVPRFKD